MKIRQSVVAVLGILLAAPACAEWQKVIETADGTTHYIDPETLRKTGNSQTVSTLQDLKNRSPGGAMSRILVEEYDCEGLRNRTVSLTLYDDRMGKGRILVSIKTPEPWESKSREWIRSTSAGIACADASTARQPASTARPTTAPNTNSASPSQFSTPANAGSQPGRASGSAAAGGAAATAPMAQAPAARPQASAAARYVWPAGVEPGNMYLVEYTLPVQGPTVYPMLVSAKSSQDALATVTRAWDAKYESMGVPPGDRRTAAVFRVGFECVGPGWAAIAEYSEYAARKPVWGAVCGYETPGEALKEAARLCTQKGTNSCDNPVPKKSEVIYTVAHSGARGWKPVFASMPSYRIAFGAFAATTVGIGGYSQVMGTREALEKMDKACESGYGKRPCFIASTKWSCVSQTSLQDLSSCVETRLTPAGFR